MALYFLGSDHPDETQKPNALCVVDDTAASLFQIARVFPQEKGLRLDRFLAKRLSEMSRTRLQSLIEGGHVKKGGRVVTRASQKVEEGDVYHICCPPLEEATPLPQKMPLPIVYEDADVIVLDKPAGLVVHPAPGHPDQTLVNGLLAHCGATLSGISGVRRPGIVHRLDKGTSGLLVVAKHDHAHHFLSTQFKEKTLSRIYLAFVWGTPSPRTGELKGFIGRHPRHRKKMALLTSGGKEAQTLYKTIACYGKGGSLVECQLGTGRTHQIRVHLASIQHSVMGDPLYGRIPSHAPQKLVNFLHGSFRDRKRQALHASVLRFQHPRLEKEMIFQSPLPEDLQFLQEILTKV